MAVIIDDFGRPSRLLDIHYRVQIARAERQLQKDMERLAAYEFERARARHLGSNGFRWLGLFLVRAYTARAQLAADRGIYIGPAERHIDGWGWIDDEVARRLRER